MALRSGALVRTISGITALPFRRCSWAEQYQLLNRCG
jgi:hypothetical protein